MADNFKFELVSPERLLLSEMVSEVVIPATEGEMTIMADHAPTMTSIKPGVVKAKLSSGETQSYVVFGGFADIIQSGCTLLAESAVPLSEISREALEKRIEAARADIEKADGHDHKTRLEQYLMELTHLNGVVIPA
ncbi:MAG: F0F1 ATP synthase subunit epsilon [Allorhizobium sp.]